MLTRYETDPTSENFEKAAAAFEDVILHGKPSTTHLWQYGFLYERRARQDLNKGLRYYQMAVEDSSAPDDQVEKAYARLVSLLVFMGRQGEAKETLNKWREGSPKAINPLIQLANLSIITGEPQQALDYCQEARALGGPAAAVALIAGDAYAALGESDLALEMWDLYYSHDSSSANALFSKAQLLEKLGRRDEAKAAWQSCVDWLVRQGFDQEGELDYPKQRLAAL